MGAGGAGEGRAPLLPKRLQKCWLMPLVSHLGTTDVKWMVQGASFPSTNRGVTADAGATFKDWESYLPCRSTCYGSGQPALQIERVVTRK